MRRIEGVSERLLACARREFLKKGFAGASLRSIAQAAETSTRAVYTRFPGKEGLFSALVAPTAEEFKDVVRSRSAHPSSGGASQGPDPSDAQGPDGSDAQGPDPSDAQGYLDLMAYVYDHYDDFVLILLRSRGTAYEAYADELAAISVAPAEPPVGRAAVEGPGDEGSGYGVHQLLEQLIAKSFFACMFEPVARGFSRADALRYMESLYCFTKSGIAGVLENEAQKAGRRAGSPAGPKPPASAEGR